MTTVCAHCDSYNMWRNQNSELYFSWTVIVPFYIMHVYLWYPVHVVNIITEAKGYLMNYMCDLKHFVISSITFDIISTNLSRLFVSKVVLSFRICSGVFVDDGNTFKKAFKKINRSLKSTYWIIFKGNHMFLNILLFFNKIQTIHVNGRGTHDVLIMIILIM